MIVEFIGTTGSGKTTLISQVHDRLASLTDARTSYDVVAAPLGLGGIRNSSMRNLVQELVSFPFFVWTLKRNRRFIFFVLAMLYRQARFSLLTLNILRSLERKLGVHAILRRDRKDPIVLVDEGTLLLAHNIFVFTSAEYTSREIDRFAALVPLPDLVVTIHAPAETLVKRSLQRRDPPREIRSRDPMLVQKYINRAAAMFDQLVQAQTICSRLFVAENCDADEAGRQRLVDEIVKFIIESKQRSQRV